MKRAIIIIAALLATGCNSRNIDRKPSEDQSTLVMWETGRGLDALYPWADPETGCEYLVFRGSNAGGITPRYEASAGGPRVKGCK